MHFEPYCDSRPEIVGISSPISLSRAQFFFTPIFCLLGRSTFVRSRAGKPNQRKGQNEKFMNFAHFCEFWCFSLGKPVRFTSNFCSGMPPGKVHELTFRRVWFAGVTPDFESILGHFGVGMPDSLLSHFSGST